MTINHLNLVVADVAKAVNFFETYFSFSRELIKGNNTIAVLKNSANFTLVLMSDKDGQPSYPKNFHIGFMLASAGAVDQLHQQLAKNGIDVLQSPQKIRDSYAFYFHFENILIEVGHYLA
jgi:predicted enzyme related to lactoylglutathione lyase